MVFNTQSLIWGRRDSWFCSMSSLFARVSRCDHIQHILVSVNHVRMLGRDWRGPGVKLRQNGRLHRFMRLVRVFEVVAMLCLLDRLWISVAREQHSLVPDRGCWNLGTDLSVQGIVWQFMTSYTSVVTT